jgi:Domain of unknown function (DUF4189)
VNNKIAKSLFFLFFPLCFFSLDSFAQTRCPVGGQAGSAQCLPDDEGAASPRPTGEWIKTWGALVSSNKAGGAWSSKGKFTEGEARQDALNRCYSTGASDCSVDATYFNQCIAAAASDEIGVDFNTGKDKDIAGKRALSDCKKRSSSQCSIKFTECTDPIFRKY